MLAQPKVLLVSSNEEESSILEGILSEHVELSRVKDLPELQGNLKTRGYDAVFCGWSFHRGKWNDALGEVQERTPDLPVVIFCRAGGEREWVEVLEAGGFDLLVPPYGKLVVLAVLEQAVGSYEMRRQKSLMLAAKTS